MQRPGAQFLAIAIVALATLTLAATPPKSPWPDVATAEAYARELMPAFKPEKLEQVLFDDPKQVPIVLRALGSALMTKDAVLGSQVTRYLGALATARARRVDRSAKKEGIRDLVAFLIADPIRFRTDRAFRAKVLPRLSGALDASYSNALRTAVLRELNLLEIDFDANEAIAASWGSLARSSSARRVAFDAKLRMPDDFSGPIEASIYSINSGFFPTANEARSFLSAVRAAAPSRRLIVLADDAMAASLEGIDVDIVPTFSRPYTPWPRDPFTVARGKDGIVLVNRPNRQPEREEDANMVRALVQNGLDAQWTVAPIPFHNGHILLTPDAAWISIHTVEIRALELLGLKRVPVQTFATKAGIEKYLGAARRAATELGALYGKPVRFVHALDADPTLMRRLGGGGGFDLDSIMTMLPQPDGSVVALVGDVNLGAKVARSADWRTARAAYGLTGTPTAQPASLGVFLDAVAAHLASSGVKVTRVPLINVPASMAKDTPKDFLLTWNNVVLDRYRAEGFASLLREGDDLARKAFADAGYELTLFPPLTKSVRHSGGYRCASNHARP